MISYFFFFTDTAITDISTLSLHDALPISRASSRSSGVSRRQRSRTVSHAGVPSGLGGASAVISTWLRRPNRRARSEEHTSELQSRGHLVCRLLLEKKKKKISNKET